jgi:4-amino-4-deoxychorismate lyase
MFPLFESICLVDGVPQRLNLHVERMERSRRILFDCDDALDLAGLLDTITAPPGLVKCRIDYGRTFGQAKCTPYAQRTLTTLALVENPALRYDHKFVDRHILENAVVVSGCDDVIFMRDGILTDTSFANIALTDGHSWVTPSTPLLEGTMRRALLEAGEMKEAELRVEDLRLFTHVALINAMMPLAMASRVPVANIRLSTGTAPLPENL